MFTGKRQEKGSKHLKYSVTAKASKEDNEDTHTIRFHFPFNSIPQYMP